MVPLRTIILLSVTAVVVSALCGCASGGGFASVGGQKAVARRLTASTYAFREGTFFEAVDKTKALGLKCVEAHSWQKLTAEFPNVENNYKAPPEAIEAAKRKLKDAGVKLVGYYFHTLGKNEAETRKVFEYARTMGVEFIVCEPEPTTLPLLDKLTAEYGVNVAIHNHPKDPKHPAYVNWNPDEVMKQLKGCSKRIGTCADTGHWVRSGVDPVEALKKYEGRTLALHLKDIEKPTVDSRDVPWGTGIGNVKAVLAELHREKFAGVFSIEYEHNPQDNMKDIAECIAYFNKVAKELGL
jgi:sugar phosphate isomerase/epimerase